MLCEQWSINTNLSDGNVLLNGQNYFATLNMKKPQKSQLLVKFHCWNKPEMHNRCFQAKKKKWIHKFNVQICNVDHSN